MKRWSEEETALLIELKEEKKLSYKEIANILGKTVSQCATKYQRHNKYNYALDGSYRSNKKWSDKEDEILRDNKDVTYDELRKLFPNRTINGIVARMKKLKLTRVANTSITHKEEQYIIDNHLKMTNAELAKELNVDRHVVARVKERENIKTEKVWNLKSIDFDENDVMSITAKFKLEIVERR